ncbi:MAG: calcium-binding protein [Pseudomonadota bacterium]
MEEDALSGDSLDAVRQAARQAGEEAGRNAALDGETIPPYAEHPNSGMTEAERAFNEAYNQASLDSWAQTWFDAGRESGAYERGHENANGDDIDDFNRDIVNFGPEPYRNGARDAYQEGMYDSQYEEGQAAAREDQQAHYEAGYANPDAPSVATPRQLEGDSPFNDGYRDAMQETNLLDAFEEGQRDAENGDPLNLTRYDDLDNESDGDGTNGGSGDGENGGSGDGPNGGSGDGPNGGSGDGPNGGSGDGPNGGSGDGPNGGSGDGPNGGSGDGPNGGSGDGPNGGSGDGPNGGPGDGPGYSDPPWRPDPDDDPFDNPPNSPLVIDLDGDGVELIALEQSQARFDLNMDGFAEATGWVSSDDALLAWDRDGNGLIEDKSELFGDRDGFADGFAALSDLDGNGDGRIDALDAAFGELFLWTDHDGDGRSIDEMQTVDGATVFTDRNGNGEIDAPELVSLADAGLVSIDLGADLIDETNAGHLVTHRSSVAWSDGSETVVEDVWFQNDTMYSLRTDLDQIELVDAARYMPELAGYGTVAGLRVSMTLDPDLLTAVQGLVQVSATATPSEFIDAFEDVLYAWTGVQDVDPLSRGDYMDARKIGVLEALYGRGFEAAGATNPGPQQAEALTALYQDALDSMAARVWVQTPVSAALLGVDVAYADHPATPLATMVQFNAATDRLVGDGDAVIAAVVGTLPEAEAQVVLQALSLDFEGAADAATTVVEGTQLDEVHTWDPSQGSVRLVANTYATAGGDDVVEIARDAASVQLSRSASQGERNDLIVTDLETGARLVIKGQFDTGNTGVTLLRFSDGTEIDAAALAQAAIRGTDGDDSLFGWITEAGVFEAGGGDDLVVGGAGADTYIWGEGDGNDTVFDKATWIDTGDMVVLRDLMRAEIAFERDGGDLVLRIAATGETLTIRDHFTSSQMQIEHVSFADGTVMTAAQIAAELPTLREGTDADDRLSGGALRDAFVGGLGDDSMTGSRGSDIYVYAEGDGNDRISDIGAAGDHDVIRFTDLARSDVEISSEGTFGDLVVEVCSTGESVRVVDQFWTADGRYGVEALEFADGTVLDADAIAQAAVRRGTDADDVMTGTRSDDIFDGGGGDDVMRGAQGSDTYRISRGDGQDRIEESGTLTDLDTIVFVDVIAEDVTASRGSGTYADIRLDTADGDSVTIARGAAGAYQGIEQIVFADGETWDSTELMAAAEVTGTDGAEYLYGSGLSEHLRGAGGVDRMFGQGGDDHFHWQSGDGDDWIYEMSTGGHDTLVLEGVLQADVTLDRVGSTLKVAVGHETISVAYAFSGAQYGIEEIVMEDAVLREADWSAL